MIAKSFMKEEARPSLSCSYMSDCAAYIIFELQVLATVVTLILSERKEKNYAKIRHSLVRCNCSLHFEFEFLIVQINVPTHR